MKALTLPATLKNLEIFIDFVLKESEQLHFDKNLQTALRLATEEIIVNVISYAYPGGEGDITVTTGCVLEPRSGLLVEISDHGTPFNPLSKPAPDLTVPIQERTIGGLGIYLLKELMDEVHYRYDAGRNVLSFIKYSKDDTSKDSGQTHDAQQG